jgi:hypothetical protein
MTGKPQAVDVTGLVPSIAPFWKLMRWDGPDDLCEAEREEAAAAGVTDLDDFGAGLCFYNEADALKVAEAMAVTFGLTFGVMGSHGSGRLVDPPEA